MNISVVYELAQKLENNSLTICSKLRMKPIVILPAGRLLGLCVNALKEYGLTVDKIADNAPEKKGKKINISDKTYEISATKDILNEYGNGCNYIINSTIYYDEILAQLKNAGINDENIFDAPVYIGGLQDKNAFLRKLKVKENEEEINSALNNLYDDKSKQELVTLLAISIVNGPVFLKGNFAEEYFNIPYFSLDDNEVFVDGGMYDGRTSQRFIELCPLYDKVYGFEANKNQIKIIEENLKQYENVTIYEKAIYSKTDQLFFKELGEGSCLDENGTNVVETVSIDECDICPTYVKLDIEGAEYAALEGMKNTVAKYSPKFAIAIYHSLEDHWRLINKIKEMDPKYNIAVMHHYGYEILYGSNLYAWKEK